MAAVDHHPDASPVTLEERIVRHCQAWDAYCDEPSNATIEFRLEEKLYVQPAKFVFGAIPEVAWLTRPREWMDEFKRAVQDLALNETVWVYRLWVETVESEGRTYFQIVILYDV
jgi:hypothetical protein